MPDELFSEESEGTVTPEFGDNQRPTETVPVDTGRGNVVQVPVGADFVPTMERLADEHNYGGYYRVFVARGRGGMSEVIDPADSPDKIEPGMRIALTSYDKVG